MQQVKLIVATTGSFALVNLENEANEWLKENSGKEIVDITIISHPGEPQLGKEWRMGWIIMIRYEEIGEASVS